MKFKSLLKIGLPLLGVSALAISLPIALTSCGNDTSSQTSENPISFQKNLSNTTSVQKGQNFLELSVKAIDQNQGKELGYQWFYKKPSSDAQTQVKLTSGGSDALQGFEKITNNPTANSSTLKVAANLQQGNNYEFVCAAYEINQSEGSSSQTPEYLFSNVTKIVVDTNSTELIDSPITTTNINNLSNLTSTLTKENLDSESNVKDGVVVENSSLYDDIFAQLGKGAKASIKSVTLDNATKESDENVILNATFYLNKGYTWSVEIFKQGEGLNTTRLLSNSLNFVINDDGSLTVKDIQTNIKTNSQGDVPISTSTLSSEINSLISTAKSWSGTMTANQEVTVDGTSNNTGSFETLKTALNSLTSLNGKIQSVQLTATGTTGSGKLKLVINIQGATLENGSISSLTDSVTANATSNQLTIENLPVNTLTINSAPISTSTLSSEINSLISTAKSWSGTMTANQEVTVDGTSNNTGSFETLKTALNSLTSLNGKIQSVQLTATGTTGSGKLKLVINIQGATLENGLISSLTDSVTANATSNQLTIENLPVNTLTISNGNFFSAFKFN